MAEEAQIDVGEPQDAQDDAPQLSEVEQLAAERGWKKDGVGRDGKSKSAAEFLRATPDSHKLEREIRDMRDQMRRMTDAHARTMDRSLKEQREEIEARFEAAVGNKDTAGAAKAARDMRELETEAAQPSAKGDPDSAFQTRNPWYNTRGNEDATDYAVAVSNRLVKQGVSGDDMFERVEEAVRKRFPEVFEGAQDDKPQPRRQPAQVAAPSRGGAPKAKGVAELPADARAAANRLAEAAFVRYNKPKDETIKAYAEDYWGNAA